MKILKLNSIQKRMYLLISLTLIASLLGISVINYIISRKELDRSNSIILKNTIESIMVDINKNYRYSQDESGWMTEEQAKNTSIAAIEDLTDGSTDGISSATNSGNDAQSSATVNSVYAEHSVDLGESGYIFIIDSDGNVIYHPFLTDNLKDLKSTDGRYIVEELVNIAKTGGGTIEYALDSDLSHITDSKMVYAKYFPHWDWVVCAVIYNNELARGADIILRSNMVSLLIILAVAMFISVLFTNRIARPIKNISKTLSSISDGDLTVEKVHIKSNDELSLLGDAVNKLLDNLSRIVKMIISSSDNLSKYAAGLKESSDYVSKATSEVANSISQMAVQTDEQFKETVESVEKVNLLGKNIKETAEASTKIGTVVEKNVELKELGLSSVQMLKAAASENNENTSVIESIIHKINDHSKAIGEITTIISNIAKQTNLLALNASIEASRAGEHGQGFTVVAEEIRKLANETANAVGDIHDKIEQMQEQSAEAVDFISKNREGVDKINQSVSKTEEIIGLISDGLQTLIEDIKVIIEHNQEINQKKDEILTKLGHVSDTAQDNSAAIEEISATAQEQSVTITEIANSISNLNAMVNDLDNLVNEFKVR